MLAEVAEPPERMAVIDHCVFQNRLSCGICYVPADMLPSYCNVSLVYQHVSS